MPLNPLASLLGIGPMGGGSEEDLLRRLQQERQLQWERRQREAEEMRRAMMMARQMEGSRDMLNRNPVADPMSQVEPIGISTPDMLREALVPLRDSQASSSLMSPDSQGIADLVRQSRLRANAANGPIRAPRLPEQMPYYQRRMEMLRDYEREQALKEEMRARRSTEAADSMLRGGFANNALRGGDSFLEQRSLLPPKYERTNETLMDIERRIREQANPALAVTDEALDSIVSRSRLQEQRNRYTPSQRRLVNAGRDPEALAAEKRASDKKMRQALLRNAVGGPHTKDELEDMARAVGLDPSRIGAMAPGTAYIPPDRARRGVTRGRANNLPAGEGPGLRGTMPPTAEEKRKMHKAAISRMQDLKLKRMASRLGLEEKRKAEGGADSVSTLRLSPQQRAELNRTAQQMNPRDRAQFYKDWATFRQSQRDTDVDRPGIKAVRDSEIAANNARAAEAKARTRAIESGLSREFPGSATKLQISIENVFDEKGINKSTVDAARKRIKDAELQGFISQEEAERLRNEVGIYVGETFGKKDSEWRGMGTEFVKGGEEFFKLLGRYFFGD